MKFPNHMAIIDKSLNANNFNCNIDNFSKQIKVDRFQRNLCNKFKNFNLKSISRRIVKITKFLSFFKKRYQYFVLHSVDDLDKLTVYRLSRIFH